MLRGLTAGGLAREPKRQRNDSINKTAFAFFSVLVAMTAGAADIYVSLEGGKNKNASTKEAPLKNLWKALEAANDGDTIHLAKGVYPGKIGSAGTVPARGDGFMRLFWLQAKSER